MTSPNIKNYDSILVFESPLTIGEERIYGYLYDTKVTPNSWESNSRYVEYLAGCKKWYDIGNEIKEKEGWVDKSRNIYYGGKDPYIQNFCKQAYLENPVAYFYKEGITFDYAEEDVDGSLIVGERFWDWAIGQMDDLDSNIPPKSMDESLFINSFESEMKKYDVSIGGDVLDLHFKVRDVEFTLECPAEFDDAYAYRFCGWNEHDGDWDFILSSYPDSKGVLIFLSFHIATDSMKSFAKTVLKNANEICHCYFEKDKGGNGLTSGLDKDMLDKSEDLPF
jgi:hypothetical protein